MSSSTSDEALERAERALLRIERSANAPSADSARDSALRQKVAAVVSELDEMILAAGPAR